MPGDTGLGTQTCPRLPDEAQEWGGVGRGERQCYQAPSYCPTLSYSSKELLMGPDPLLGSRGAD